MSDAVLALNAGSSSIKFGLFLVEDRSATLLLRGLLDDQGKEPRLLVKDRQGAVLEDRRWGKGAGLAELIGSMLDWIEHHLEAKRLVAVGHRIVHGGPEFTAPVRLTKTTIAAVDRLTPLAPLHQPRSLEPIRAVGELRPDLPQVGCFDTAFHHTLEPPVSRYALPRRLEAEGVRKYGFHGLSYEFIAGRLGDIDADLPGKRTIVAHLGSGASLCAMQHGRSLDTTMGFSALDGLVMGTRPGLLDPGVVLYLQRAKGMSAEAVEHMLYHECGLLGVSELSSDMRVLSDSADPRAAEAIELFAFRIGREAAAMAHTMGGLEAVVFTGGVGEHAAAVRASSSRRLAWLGLDIDEAANEASATRISGPGSRIAAYIVPTDEEAVIARHTIGLALPG